MKKELPAIIEKGRFLDGPLRSKPGSRNGACRIKCPETNRVLNVIFSDGIYWAQEGLDGPPWEHVSVNGGKGVPFWAEMCWVKELFFEEDEWVVQFCPAKKDCVNLHESVLHLWRPCDGVFPKPPKECV